MLSELLTLIFFNNFSLNSIYRIEFSWNDCMKNKLLYTGALLILLFCSANGQETISTDKTEGCDSLEVQLTLNTSSQLGDYTSVVWDFGDGSTGSGALTFTHTYTSPGTYTVLCTLDDTKVITGDEFITVGRTPYADFVYKDSSANESEYSFYFQAKYYKPDEGETIDYEWKFPDGTVVNDSIALHTFPEGEVVEEIYLILTGDGGCVDTILRKIPVSHELMPPNVFTPNGDMINDYFEVSTQGDYIYSFRVFTRTGTQVYYSRSEQIIWDGRTTGGREVPEGVYY